MAILSTIITGTEIPAPDFEFRGSADNNPWLTGLEKRNAAMARADTITPVSIAVFQSVSGDALSSEPSVFTDKGDYAPGEAASITAGSFDTGARVTFGVDHISHPGADDETVELFGDGHNPWTVIDGGVGELDGEAYGNIVTEWQVNPDDSPGETFLVTAAGVEASADSEFGTEDDVTGSKATYTFTNGAPDVEAYHNLNDAWSGGTTIQQANSTHAENESILFRYTQSSGNPAPQLMK